MDAKDPISSGELAVFQTYADLVNSERATMWARHNAMLVANSLILSAWPSVQRIDGRISPCSPPGF